MKLPVSYYSFVNTVLVLFGMIFLYSCSQNQNVVSSTYSGLYDFEQYQLHPEFKIFHSKDDSSELHYYLNSKELLYARGNPEEKFRSDVSISILAKNYEGIILDSLSMTLRDTNSTKISRELFGFVPLAIPDTAKGIMEIKVLDKFRNSSQKVILAFNKLDRFGPENYLPVHQSTDKPIFGQSVPSNSAIEVRLREGVETQVQRVYGNSPPLPPPPFSFNPPVELDASDHQFKSELTIVDNRVFIQRDSGLIYLSQAENAPRGMILAVRQDHFPNVQTLDELIRTVRYITSRSEFEDLNFGNEGKAKLDKFWIDCGGSKEKARDLIRIYYNRIEEANFYFSSHLEGWKTDRGLVHVIYGNPNKIFKHPEYETWLYGEENNLNALSFTFRKKDSPFSNNHFVLNRDPVYKSSWSRAVDSWRSGRIYTD